MFRSFLLSAAVAALTASPVTRSIPTPCQLLTAQDAKTLGGFSVADPDEDRTECSYARAGQSPLAIPPDVVDFKILALSDSAAAKTRFPRWSVRDTQGPETKVSNVPSLADEAFISRTPSDNLSGIAFRKGARMMSIGVHPAVSDAALVAAAKAVLARL